MLARIQAQAHANTHTNAHRQALPARASARMHVDAWPASSKHATRTAAPTRTCSSHIFAHTGGTASCCKTCWPWKFETRSVSLLTFFGSSLSVCADGVWRKVRESTSCLLSRDAELARQVLIKHRALFADLSVNVLAMGQRMPSHLASFGSLVAGRLGCELLAVTVTGARTWVIFPIIRRFS